MQASLSSCECRHDCRLFIIISVYLWQGVKLGGCLSALSHKCTHTYMLTHVCSGVSESRRSRTWAWQWGWMGRRYGVDTPTRCRMGSQHCAQARRRADAAIRPEQAVGECVVFCCVCLFCLIRQACRRIDAELAVVRIHKLRISLPACFASQLLSFVADSNELEKYTQTLCL